MHALYTNLSRFMLYGAGFFYGPGAGAVWQLVLRRTLHRPELCAAGSCELLAASCELRAASY